MYRIALVIDESFGKRVMDLGKDAYVWLVQSPENEKWAKLFWDIPKETDDPLLRDVSTFVRQENEDVDSLVVRLLDMIDEHHGEFAHDPEWSEIEVFGASPTSTIKKAASEYGVDRFELTQEGFRMIRTSS